MRASSCAAPRSASSSSLAVRAAASSPLIPRMARRAASGTTAPPMRTSSIRRSKIARAGGLCGVSNLIAARAEKKKDGDDRFDPDAAPSFADSEFAGVATALAFVAVFGGALALLLSLAKPVIDNTLNSIPVR